MRAAACLECAAARAATRYRSAATASCTTDLLRRGSAHCTRSADIAATLAGNEWFELEGPRTASLRRRRLLPRVLGSIVSTLSKTGAHRRHLGAHQGKATSRPFPPVWSGLCLLPSPGQIIAARGHTRPPTPLSDAAVPSSSEFRAANFGDGRWRRNWYDPRTRPLRVGRRYPAAAPDGSPSRAWDSGVRPAPPSPSSPPSSHSGRRRTWAGAGRAFGHAAPAAAG